MTILGFSWAVWLAWLLSAFFVINGVVNLLGPKPIRDGFTRWGYPSWFHIVNGLVQIAIGLMMGIPSTQMIGLALGVLYCIAIYFTLLRHREWSHLPPSAILFVLILIAGWANWV